MKKMNNKGFSLVELIIVIAIMAILIGVLAPQYIKYVEKSRRSADLDTLDSVYNACTTAASDADIADAPYNNASSGYSTVSLTGSSWGSEVLDTLGIDAIGDLSFKSKSAGSASLQIGVDSNGNFSVAKGSLSVGSTD